MHDNMPSIIALARTIEDTSSQLATLSNDFMDIKDTAENAYRLASNANPLIASQKARLSDLMDDVSCLNLELDDLKASTATPPGLETLVQSAIAPVKASMDMALALANRNCGDGNKILI